MEHTAILSKFKYDDDIIYSVYDSIAHKSVGIDGKNMALIFAELPAKL